eukprot:Plantae.Rhodophyta-Purpureofilum_apyrenoidigerum.ctg5409.p1 GENE.Plantae.Rhodophyta-Purpureofilum_apyrenoidigerum.ctg5409~~Plantae.Rhodophyta-Purpureofilum_apyrenoidigerum.ctg5409.p1  ORF type:complete len:442 (-),score=82.75 Plantae.Rhodophyta-Purpureofilum_apyrenoidigerum.ctg5409:313-1536(-)
MHAFVHTTTAAGGFQRGGLTCVCGRSRLGETGFVHRGRNVVRSSQGKRLLDGERERTVPKAVFIWQKSPNEDSDKDDNSSDADDVSGESAHDEGDEKNDFELGSKGPRGKKSAEDRNGATGAAFGAMTKSLSIYSRLKDSTPENMESVRVGASSEAFFVIQRTAQGMVGSLSPNHFDIRITMERVGIDRLLYSSMVTGYVLKNAEYRMRMNDKLREGLGQVFTSRRPRKVEPAETKENTNGHPEYMHEVPDKKLLIRENVEGKVTWKIPDDRKEVSMEANEYMDQLEAEIASLQEKLRPQMPNDMTNRLLLFLTRLPHQTVTSLGAEISQAASLTMRRILSERLGFVHESKLQMNFTMSREYLAQYICWCLLIGYNIRNFEKQEEVTELLTSYRRGMHKSSQDDNRK